MASLKQWYLIVNDRGWLIGNDELIARRIQAEIQHARRDHDTRDVTFTPVGQDEQLTLTVDEHAAVVRL